jgi:SAM-dependent methyltransferase
VRDGQTPRLVLGPPRHVSAPESHDRSKKRLIDPKQSPWLHALGVTTAEGKVCAGMEAKFRQINKFVEILQPLLVRAGRDRAANVPSTEFLARKTMAGSPLTLVDMGCGKGYLTFAAYELLRRAGWTEVSVRGIEARSDLVELCQRAASGCGFSGLHFAAGTIESTSLDQVDVLVALHACDTATDDAIAKGIQARAALILVAPCCHKELRPQLSPPPVLAETLKHGILRERQAEFITDALRAALLEWAGYDTQVFEFISTEHTAKNLMIAAVKRGNPTRPDEEATRVRNLSAFYGIRSQRLAGQLGFDLSKPRMNTNEHE